MYYFAYGSNMSLRRIAQRLQSVEKHSLAELPHHQLKFHKQSPDGSAKCDAFYTGSKLHRVIGVIWHIDESEVAILDEFEGPGYDRETVQVITADGEEIVAHTYLATQINDNLKPYHWYKAHVLAGAREHGLPEDYIRLLERIESQMDEDADRVDRELAIYR